MIIYEIVPLLSQPRKEPAGTFKTWISGSRAPRGWREWRRVHRWWGWPGESLDRLHPPLVTFWTDRLSSRDFHGFTIKLHCLLLVFVGADSLFFCPKPLQYSYNETTYSPWSNSGTYHSFFVQPRPPVEFWREDELIAIRVLFFSEIMSLNHNRRIVDS